MRILYDYAMRMVGTPYRWSGNNTLQGIDCSGLVMELLKSAGEPTPTPDMNAQMLFDHFSNAQGEYNRYTCGALAFYGESASKVTHVAMLLDQYRIIESGGGGHLVLTKEDAAAKGAMVRIRVIGYRKDLIAVIRPRYVGIGAI